MYNDDDGGEDKENESISRTEHHYFSRARTATEKTNARHRFSVPKLAWASFGQPAAYLRAFFFDKLLKHTYY